MFAIIATGSKQYLVTTASKISIEKINGQPTDKIAFDQVLLRATPDGSQLEIGAPILEQPITGTITRQYRARKIMVRKFKNKIRYRRTAGHRQNHTEVIIDKIE